MLKYAKIIDNQTGLCEVGIGTNENFYKKIGMTKLDVTQADFDNQWYLTEKTNTDNYIQKQLSYIKEKRIAEIHTELDELDLKRVRALCEPELKDAEAGITWLEYYNNQINELRTELNGLEE